MNRLLGIVLVLCTTSTAIAATRAELDSEQTKALANAIIAKSKIPEGGSLKAVINLGQIFETKIAVINSFKFQYVNASGQCLEEPAEVITQLQDVQHEVTFFRSFPSACK